MIKCDNCNIKMEENIYSLVSEGSHWNSCSEECYENLANELYKEISKLGRHMSIGTHEFWSIDIIGGLIEIDSKKNSCYIKIKNGEMETIVHLNKEEL
jgi:hypothetical protein